MATAAGVVPEQQTTDAPQGAPVVGGEGGI